MPTCKNAKFRLKNFQSQRFYLMKQKNRCVCFSGKKNPSRITKCPDSHFRGQVIGSERVICTQKGVWTFIKPSIMVLYFLHSFSLEQSSQIKQTTLLRADITITCGTRGAQKVENCLGRQKILRF